MTVAVVIPVVLFALGAEARAFDRRTRRDREEHPVLDSAIRDLMDRIETLPDLPAEAGFLRIARRQIRIILWALNSLPSVFNGYGMLRAGRKVAGWFGPLAILGFLWGLTILALMACEAATLVWLGGVHPEGGDWPWLAYLSIASNIAGMVLLLAGPTARLFWFQIASSDLRESGLPDEYRVSIQRKIGVVVPRTAPDLDGSGDQKESRR